MKLLLLIIGIANVLTQVSYAANATSNIFAPPDARITPTPPPADVVIPEPVVAPANPATAVDPAPIPMPPNTPTAQPSATPIPLTPKLVVKTTPTLGYPLGLKTSFGGKAPLDSLYLRAGWAIDQLGINANQTAGSSGGNEAIVNLENVTKVKVTSGVYCYGGRSVGAIEFFYKDGTSRKIGSSTCFANTTTKTVDLKGKQIIGLDVWSTGYLVSGISFKTN